MLLATWIVSGPGIKPVSPTLADGFLSMVPPGRSHCFIINTSFLVDDAGSSSSSNNNSDNGNNSS